MSRSFGELPLDSAEVSSATPSLRRPLPASTRKPAEDHSQPAQAAGEAFSLTSTGVTPHLNVRGGDTVCGTALACGQRVGDHVILEEIARGGMGVVCKARQLGLNRVVALKMILGGEFADSRELLRFHTEARAIAALHHPHLVSIFEIGAHAGLPYYTMEYLEGGPLTRRIQCQSQEPHDAVRLLLPLVLAVDFAHTHGIIHRDLKPANILLSSATAPLSATVAKIADFGIAKDLSGNQQLTRTGEILGTPNYMAPEQATSAPVGPAADIYSLGAILYETLTGRPPIMGGDPADTLLRVVHQEPAAPRELNPTIPLDLSTICLKCLEKDPRKRYASAVGLAEDLRRWLADEPILARPPSLRVRVCKWVRRNPTRSTLIGAGLLLALVLFGSVVSFWRGAETRAQLEAQLLASKEKNLVEVQTLLADALLERAIGMAEKHDVRRGLHWMVRSLELAEEVSPRDSRGRVLSEAIRYNLAHWGEQAARSAIELPHPGWAWDVTFSPDGRLAVTGCVDKQVRVWNARTGSTLGAPLAHAAPVWAVRYHPSGQFLFSGAGAETGEIRVFQTESGPAGPLTPCGAPVRTPLPIARLGLAPAGAHLFALQRNGPALLFAFNAGTGELRPQVTPVEGSVVGAAFSPDSKTLYLAARSGQVIAFDLERQKSAAAWELDGSLTALALSPDGRKLAVATYDTTEKTSAVHLWDLASNEKHPRVLACPGGIKLMTFSPCSQRLAASVIRREKNEWLGEVQLVEFGANGSATKLIPPLHHPRPVWAMAFHPSGQHLLTGCEDRHSRIFEVATGTLIAPPVWHLGNVNNLALSPNGRQLLTACSGGDRDDRARIQELPSLGAAPSLFGPGTPLQEVQWDENGRQLYARDHAEHIVCLDPVTGRLLRTIRPPLPNGHQKFATPRHLVTFEPATGRMALIDLATNATLCEFSRVAHMHDTHGSQIAGLAPVYNRATKKLVFHALVDPARQPISLPVEAPLTCLFVHEKAPAFGVPVFGGPLPTYTRKAPDQPVHEGCLVRIWDLQMQVRRSWTFPYGVYGAGLSPRGEILTVLGPQRACFFDVATGAPIGRGISIEQHPFNLCFHPSEPVVVLGLADGSVFQWHIPSARRIGRTIRLPVERPFVSARPDGSGYLSGGPNHRTITFPHLAPKAGSPAELKRWVEELTGMTLDANDELTPLLQSKR